MQIDWWRGVAAGAACAVIWGLQSVVTRQAVADKLTAADVTALRFLVSGLVLLPIALRMRPRLVGRLGWGRAIVLSLLAGAPYSLVLVAGLGLAPAVHQAVITPGLIPVFATLLAAFVAGERAAPVKWLGLGLILLGIGIFFRDGLSDMPSREGSWRGDVLFVLAAVMWALFGLLSQRWRADPIETTASTCVVSLLSAPLWMAVLPIQLQHAGWGPIALQALYQGLLVGAVSLFLYTRAVELIGSAATALFLPLMPVVAGVGAFVFLGEQPTISEIGGMLAVAAGMAAALSAPRRA